MSGVSDFKVGPQFLAAKIISVRFGGLKNRPLALHRAPGNTPKGEASGTGPGASDINQPIARSVTFRYWG